MHINLDDQDIELIRDMADLLRARTVSPKLDSRIDKLLDKLKAPSMQALGGLATRGISTEAKTLAARENGRKGGRPRTKPV